MAFAMGLPDATVQVASPPNRGGDWRGHIFFFWLSIVGTVGTLLGVVLGVYFYRASLIKPLLTFGVHPLKTELLRPDYDKELGFIYKGKPVDSESITAIQASIWNAGTKSIRDSDVLEPFRLVMPNGSAILSVRVKKSSRAICGFETVDNQEDYKSGTCRLKWRILEPSDGAVVQIIYAGSARGDPTLEGAVEGQRDGVVVEQYDLSGDRNIEMRLPTTGLLGFVVLAVGGSLLIAKGIRMPANTEAAKKLAAEMAEVQKRLGELQKIKLPASPVSWVFVVGGLVCFSVIFLWLWSWSSTHVPPFGW